MKIHSDVWNVANSFVILRIGMRMSKVERQNVALPPTSKSVYCFIKDINFEKVVWYPLRENPCISKLVQLITA